MTLVLQPHPAADALSPVRVEATATRDRDVLVLAYAVVGDLARVRVPAPAAPERADELWRTTCLEAFVRLDGPDGSDGLFAPASYIELNLSPSSRWAAYAFDGYRAGTRPAALPTDPQIEIAAGPDRLELRARVDLTGVLPSGAPWRLGLSAVIEDVDGPIAYLALAHAPGRPDFHHPDGFALQLTDDA